MKSIIMSGDHPTKIIKGLKTQTRRVITLKGFKGFSLLDRSTTPGYDWSFLDKHGRWNEFRNADFLKLARYQVGDIAYVKESHMYYPTPGCSFGEAMRGTKITVQYRDGVKVDLDNDATVRTTNAIIDATAFSVNPDRYGLWNSPMFMRREFSRITIRITRVWAEQVQDISEADAKAEGIEPEVVDSGGFEPWGSSINVVDFINPYAQLWDSINGKTHPWADNPWEWGYEFEVVTDAN